MLDTVDPQSESCLLDDERLFALFQAKLVTFDELTCNNLIASLSGSPLKCKHQLVWVFLGQTISQWEFQNCAPH